MAIVVQSGASRQEHHKKEIHATKKTTNSAAKKRKSAVQYPEKEYFAVLNRQRFKISLHMFVIAYFTPKTRRWSIA